MVKRFLNTHALFLGIAAVFVVLQVFYVLRPGIVSWDGSVYVGMGKYLYSGGTVGVWEALRPIGLPIVLGFFWKIGIDPYAAGTVLAMLFSIAFLALAYAIGERMRKNAGVLAAALIAATPVFFLYSVIPMTDIASTAFVLAALWVCIVAKQSRQLLWAGIFIGLACMFRFPQGLMLVAAGVIVVADRWYFVATKRQRASEKALAIVWCGSWLAVGFAIVVVPFLIANVVVYHDASLPFKEGNAIIKGFPGLYHKGFRYYFAMLWQQNAGAVLALLPFFLFRTIGNKKQQYRTAALVAVTLVVYGAYFLYQPHKELRYMLAFLPYVLLLSGFGIALLAERLRFDGRLAVLVILFFGTVASVHMVQARERDDAPTVAFSRYFADKPGAAILSTEPFPVRYGDVHIVRTLYNDWRDAYNQYVLYKRSIDYVALDSCIVEIGCEAGDTACYARKDELLHVLDTTQEKVFSATLPGSCDARIYRITK